MGEGGRGDGVGVARASQEHILRHHNTVDASFNHHHFTGHFVHHVLTYRKSGHNNSTTIIFKFAVVTFVGV